MDNNFFNNLESITLQLSELKNDNFILGLKAKEKFMELFDPKVEYIDFSSWHEGDFFNKYLEGLSELGEWLESADYKSDNIITNTLAGVLCHSSIESNFNDFKHSQTQNNDNDLTLTF